MMLFINFFSNLPNVRNIKSLSTLSDCTGEVCRFNMLKVQTVISFSRVLDIKGRQLSLAQLYNLGIGYLPYLKW